MSAVRRIGWWLPEERRGWMRVLAAGGMVVGAALTGLVPRPAAERQAFTNYAISLVVAELALYLALYVVLTWFVFRHAPPESVRAWAARTRQGSWVDKYVLAKGPGTGLATTAASLALMAVFLLPRAGGEVPSGVPVVLSVVVIVAAWLAVALSYSVDYLCRDARGPRGLDFPGTPQPVWSDYLYFSLSVSVSTTFGTTDTAVCHSAMRRVVATHGLIAFAFNTVILASVVGVVVAR